MTPYSVQHFRDALTALVRHDEAPEVAVAPRLALVPRRSPELDRAGLTGRELQVVLALSDGLRNREIGRELGIAENTVRCHVQHISDKLGTSSRNGIVGRALRVGVVA